MNHKGILSSAFNMSLGYLPVIISIILCEFITQDTAIYIGTGIGMLYSYYSMHRKGVRIPNFILYISTFMLMLLTLAALIPGDYVPPGALPLTLEVSILIPMLSLYLHKKRFINYFLKKKDICSKRMFAQGAEISYRIGTHHTDIGIFAFYHHQSGHIFLSSDGKDDRMGHIQPHASRYFHFMYHLQSDRHPLF